MTLIKGKGLNKLALGDIPRVAEYFHSPENDFYHFLRKCSDKKSFTLIVWLGSFVKSEAISLLFLFLYFAPLERAVYKLESKVRERLP